MQNASIKLICIATYLVKYLIEFACTADYLQLPPRVQTPHSYTASLEHFPLISPHEIQHAEKNAYGRHTWQNAMPQNCQWTPKIHP